MLHFRPTSRSDEIDRNQFIPIFWDKCKEINISVEWLGLSAGNRGRGIFVATKTIKDQSNNQIVFNTLA